MGDLTEVHPVRGRPPAVNREAQMPWAIRYALSDRIVTNRLERYEKRGDNRHIDFSPPHPDCGQRVSRY